MQPQRHVRLFRTGRNQALRIPREFELDADEATIRRDAVALPGPSSGHGSFG